jgi:hypothetical protein
MTTIKSKIEIYKRYDSILEKIESRVECETDPGTSFAHLRWMLSELMKETMPQGKSNRWLGFIQGMMIAKGLATVAEERDFTRPFFTNEI